MSWKYVDDSNAIVTRTNSDGSVVSCQVEAIADWVAEGNIPAPAFTDAERVIKVADKIKTERDRRWYEGGVKVGTYWFLSTVTARTEYQAMLLLSAGLDDSVVLQPNWRTMSGATVDMTVGLAKAILLAGFTSVKDTDNAYLAHLAALQASNSPATYSFDTGWPLIFGE